MIMPFRDADHGPDIEAGHQDRIDAMRTMSDGRGGSNGTLKPMEFDSIQSAVRLAMDSAVDFMDEVASPRRIAIDAAYQGAVSLAKVPGRSNIVVSSVRDAVKSVIASIARIFTQSDVIGQFVSDDVEDERMCKDATVFVNSVFWKSGGYNALIEASTDSLKAMLGAVKVWIEDRTVVSHQAGGIEAAQEMPGQMTEMMGVEAIMTTSSTRKTWHIESVPPEELVIDAQATSVDNARLIAHRRWLYIYEATALGFSADELLPYSQTGGDDDSDGTMTQTERDSRRDYSFDEQEASASDIMARRVLLSECYMRLDADGDGIAELRRIVTAGQTYSILSDEPVNYLPFALVWSEMQPHVLYPICLAEDLIQDQNAQTALLRSIIDNAALVNSPRTEVVDTLVNMNDVLNGEIGAVIRVKAPGQITELATPFVAGQTLPVLQYLQDVAQSRSGVTKLSQGIDADALQGTSRIAANAVVSSSDARIELMARNIGESGVKSLLLAILRCAIDNLQGEQQIRLPEGFMTVRPEWWHDQVSVRVNVGLGSGRIDEKKAALQQILQIQQMLVQAYGPANPMCTWSNVQNTLRDMLRLSGLHTTSDYFPYVPPEQVQQIDQQQKQMQQAQSQAQQAQAQAQIAQGQQQAQLLQGMLAAEKEKNQIKMQEVGLKHQQEMADLQAQLAKAQADQMASVVKAKVDDDRERDRMELDFYAKMKGLMQTDAQIALASREADAMAEVSKPS